MVRLFKKNIPMIILTPGFVVGMIMGTFFLNGLTKDYNYLLVLLSFFSYIIINLQLDVLLF